MVEQLHQAGQLESHIYVARQREAVLLLID